MGDFFDTMTIVVVIIMVFLVLVIAIHASARLVQMTFSRKSGLKQKDTVKSNEAVKNAENPFFTVSFLWRKDATA